MYQFAEVLIKNKIIMKKLHPFYSIGTIGMILTACLHMFLALGLSLTNVHTAFFMIYPMFLAFLIIGVV